MRLAPAFLTDIFNFCVHSSPTVAQRATEDGLRAGIAPSLNLSRRSSNTPTFSIVGRIVRTRKSATEHDNKQNAGSALLWVKQPDAMVPALSPRSHPVGSSTSGWPGLLSGD